MAPCMRVSPFYSLFSFSVSLLHVCMPCQIDKPLRGLSRGGVCMGEHTDFICTSFQYLFCLGMHLVIISFCIFISFHFTFPWVQTSGTLFHPCQHVLEMSWARWLSTFNIGLACQESKMLVPKPIGCFFTPCCAHVNSPEQFRDQTYLCSLTISLNFTYE